MVIYFLRNTQMTKQRQKPVLIT